MWQRKGGGGDYKTLKQHISNTGKLAEGSEAQVSVPYPSQWHFTEEKKLLMNQYSHALFCMSVLIERV